jgi:hypothetical protein
MPALSDRKFANGVLAVGTIGGTVAMMAAINETLRAHLLAVFTRTSSSELASTTRGIQRAVSMVADTVGDYSAAHTPLVLFALIAAALLVLLLRS